jgi:Icc protein
LITFFHFSDFHILPERGMLRDEGDPCKKVEKVIEIAGEMGVKPAFSIITGDISQNGSETGYNIAREYISQIEALGGPVLPAVGNVDRRRNFRRILLGKACSDDDSPCCYSRTIGGLHVIILDSQTPGSDKGSFEREQLSWLEGELRCRAEPSIIAFHHPVFEYPLLRDANLEIFDPVETGRFRDIVSDANVAAVLCGHLHQGLVTSAGGVEYVTACGILSELVLSERESRVYDSSGFNVLTYRDGSLTVRPVIYSEGRRLVKRVQRG